MFDVTIGPITVEVECPLLEDTAANVQQLGADLARVEQKVDQILATLGTTGQPYVAFTIGPVRPQE